MSAMYVGKYPGEPPTGRGAASASLLLCVLPLSTLWCVGAFYGPSFVVIAPESYVGHITPLRRVALLLRVVLLLGGSGIGLAALWSALLPRAVHGAPTTGLRRWQLYGLRIGSLAALVVGVGLVAGERFEWGAVLGAGFFAWPVLVARWLTRESGQWLFIPWPAR
jgi:hypothetical protein